MSEQIMKLRKDIIKDRMHSSFIGVFILVIFLGTSSIPSYGLIMNPESVDSTGIQALNLPEHNMGVNTRASMIHWTGVMILTEDFLVPEGWTLYIAPGSKVYPKINVGIYVEGTLKIDGYESTEITFEAFDQVSKWKGIQFNETASTIGSYIRHCTISDAETAIRYRTGKVVLDEITFTDNLCGLDMYLSDGTMLNSMFESNNFAIKSDASNPVIENSTIKSSSTNDFVITNSSSVTAINVIFDTEKIKIDDYNSKLNVYYYLKISLNDPDYSHKYNTNIAIIDFNGNEIYSLTMNSSDATNWIKCKSFTFSVSSVDPNKISVQYYTSHIVKIHRFGLTKSEMIYLDSNKHLTVSWSGFSTIGTEAANIVNPTSQQALMHDFCNLGWKHTTRQEKLDTLYYLKDRMLDFGQYKIQYDNHTHENYLLYNGSYADLHLTNLVCTKPGNSPSSDGYIVISAHYDTDDNVDTVGADDDGSGVVALLEIARLIGRMEFNTTIKFIFFDGEEEKYIGSYDYVKWAESSGHDIITDINLDMIGYNKDSGYPCIIRTNTQSLEIAQIFPDLNDAAGLNLDVTIINDKNYRRSDYFNFWDFGYRAVNFVEADTVETWNPYYHSSSDSYDKINFTYLPKMTGLALAGLMELAEPVNSDPTEPAELSPTSTHLLRPILTWRPSMDLNGDDIHYRLKVALNNGMSTNRAEYIIDIELAENAYTFETNLSFGGTYRIELTALDEFGGSSASLESDLYVYNTPPVLSEIPDQYLIQNTPWELQITAVDNDLPKDTLKYYENTDLFELDRSSGIVRWTPTKYDVSEHLVNFSVFDGYGGLDYQLVKIFVENVNDAPEVISKSLALILDEDSILHNAVNLSEVFFDADGDELEFKLNNSGNINFKFLDNGSVDVSAQKDWFGTEYVELVARDPSGLNSSILIEVIIRSVNDAPILHFIPDIYLNETEILILDPEALDVDSHNLIFNYSWQDFSGNWQTDYFSAGIYSLNVTVSDGEVADWQQLQIVVANVNRPPILKGDYPPSREIEVKKQVSFTAEFLDPDDDYNNNGVLDGFEHDNLTYLWDLGDGTQITGKIAEHRYSKSGVFEVTLSVTDRDNGTAVIKYNLTVKEKHDQWSQAKLMALVSVSGLAVFIVIIFLVFWKRGKLKQAVKKEPIPEVKKVKKRIPGSRRTADVEQNDTLKSNDSETENLNKKI